MTYPITAHGFRHGPMEQTLPSGLYGVSRYRVTELAGSKHLQWYWFDYGFETGSKTARMINWFFHGGSSQRRKKKTWSIQDHRCYNPIRGVWYVLHGEDDLAVEAEMRAGPHGWVYPKLPELYLPDLNSFFTTVGFDYKTKKWIP